MADDIGKHAAGFDLFLLQRVVANIPHVFPLAGQAADPFQFPSMTTAVGVILDEVPHSESDLVQFIADEVGVALGVLFATDFDPPEIIALGTSVFHPWMLSGEDMRPARRHKRSVFGCINFTHLQQQRIAHGLTVSQHWRRRLVELVLGFASPAEFRTAGAQHRITRAVGKLRCFDTQPSLSREMPGFDGGDTPLLAFATRVYATHGGIQNQLQIFLEARLLINDRIPHRVRQLTIAVTVGEKDLFNLKNALPHS